MEPLTLKIPFKPLISIAYNFEKLYIFARWQSKCENLYHAHDHSMLLFQPKWLNVFQEQSLEEKESCILIHEMLFNAQSSEKKESSVV